jgi:glutamate-1-semialdehyde 2,1-aminomutase
MTSGPGQADLRRRALACMPGGVNSNVRLQSAGWFFERGSGAWLWDTDGHDYVDYALGMGAMFLGHAHPTVGKAVQDATGRGMVYGAQHPLEVEAAEAVLNAIGWADRVRLGLTGSEAVHAALRLARAATNRNKIVRFAGHYHGWLDNILIPLDAATPRPASDGQPASCLQDLFVIPWNEPEQLELLLADHGEEIAAVIMEPIMLNTGASEPLAGFLQLARQLCTRHGIVLVFDEVITGFRVAQGGAVQRYGVVPDLATFGKAMAGGWPVAALAGNARYMDLFADGSVNHSGTFNGSTMACAAVVATVELLRGEPPYASVQDFGRKMMAALPEVGKDHGVAVVVDGLPMAFSVSAGVPDEDSTPPISSKVLASQLHQALAEVGIWTTTRGLWFVSAAHGDEELATTLGRVGKALDAFRAQLVQAR